MKSEINLKENKSVNFLKRTAYSLQVLTIALGIPMLSFMQMTHVDKSETPSSKTIHVQQQKPDALAFILK